MTTVDAEWLGQHFDHLDPALAPVLYESMAYLRREHPVARSDQYGGFVVATRYEDVLSIVQDWETWSSAEGMTIPYAPTPTPVIPEQADPPIHRDYKRLINQWFRPAVVLRYEQAARHMVAELIDGFVERGECDFMTEFARVLPGRVFFEQVLHAPSDAVAAMTAAAGKVSSPNNPDSRAAMGEIMGWIGQFVEQRRNDAEHDDVIHAILTAEIQGRPITEQEVMGLIMLLLFGGLDTTAGALGMMMIRFCQDPSIPALLRSHPERTEDIVEELLRLDGSFVAIARTATRDTAIGGCPVAKGERVLLSWASANRDDAVFPDPDTFDHDRGKNPHIAFGAGPHRCAGSNLARMNLRIAVAELARRLDGLRLDMDPSEIHFHSTFNRGPESVRIAFTPGSRTAPARP